MLQVQLEAGDAAMRVPITAEVRPLQHIVGYFIKTARHLPALMNSNFKSINSLG